MGAGKGVISSTVCEIRWYNRGMPLLDHFHPPLKLHRHWHAFHNAWATYLASDLNHRLPARYFAEANVQFGIEIDVATFEESGEKGGGSTSVKTVTKPAIWTPPLPTETIAFSTIGDIVEVQIYDTTGGPELVGAVEIISPSNKDRDAHRQAFVSKCLTYLQRGIGLVIVDIVTERHLNLHNDIIARIPDVALRPLSAGLYACAYHVLDRDGSIELDLWANPLTLGEPMPIMPLWIRGNFCVPLNLESTYQCTCQEYRIGVEIGREPAE